MRAFENWAQRHLAVPRWIVSTLYFLFALLGVAAFIIGIPTIELTTFEGWVGIWGIVVTFTGCGAAVFSLRERWEPIERSFALLLVAFLDSYTIGAWALVATDPEQAVARGGGAIVLTIMAFIPTVRLAYMISRMGRGKPWRGDRAAAVVVTTTLLSGATASGEPAELDLTWLPGVLALLGVLAMAGASIWNRRRGEGARRQDMTPPSWPDVYARLDSQDKKIRLLVGIVAAAADQWPPDAPPPQFDHETVTLIKELDDTLVPEKWRRIRPRPHTA